MVTGQGAINGRLCFLFSQVQYAAVVIFSAK